MKIVIRGKSKEIAALLQQLDVRQKQIRTINIGIKNDKGLFLLLSDRDAYNLICEECKNGIAKSCRRV